jgi:hypothetical protein
MNPKTNLFALIFLTLFLKASTGATPPFQRVDADLKSFDDKVARMNEQFSQIPADPKSKKWVILDLQHMVDVDQYTIKFRDVIYDHGYSTEERQYFEPLHARRYWNIAKVHASALKTLLILYEWITVSAFGASADDNAWLIVQHDDQELEFQKQILPILGRLYPKGETRKSNYAYLFDRIAVHDTPPRKQRYGSQGRCVGPGEWQPDPIEDEENVDKRRAAMGMVSMAEYKTWFKDRCKE